MSRRATTMNIYIYDRTWSKYSKAFSESKSESDLNFSCLQKLKAKKKGKKKKKNSAWFICRNLFGDIGVSKTYQQEQVFNYEVFNYEVLNKQYLTIKKKKRKEIESCYYYIWQLYYKIWL